MPRQLLARFALVAVTVAWLLAGAAGVLVGAGRREPPLPPEKARRLEQEAENASRARPPRAKPALPGQERPTGLPPRAGWATGIFGDDESPDGRYRVVNRWVARGPGGYLVVYAGSYRSDPAQGVLVLTRSVPGRGVVRWRAIRSPDRSGALRIVATLGNGLTVASPGGRFFFDPVTGAISR